MMYPCVAGFRRSYAFQSIFVSFISPYGILNLKFKNMLFKWQEQI